MTNTPFTLAPPGWYSRPGDPTMLVRWWDGQAWTRQVRGPMPPDPFPIQSLVDGHERENAPLAQPASAQPSFAPRAFGAPQPSMAPGWAAASWNQPKPQRQPLSRGKKVLVLAFVLVAVVAVGGIGYGVSTLFGNKNTADLTVGACVTIAAPVLKSTETDVGWTKADCQTVAGAPVSYQITQKLTGAGTCEHNEYLKTYLARDGKVVSVTNTYCLMENLAVGECIYADTSKFEFDVPCTDSRATAKVTKRVEQGSGVTCAAHEAPLTYNPPGRTYCVTKP